MFNDYYAKVNDDYRREMLTRSWTQPVRDGNRRRGPRLPRVLRHGRGARRTA